MKSGIISPEMKKAWKILEPSLAITNEKAYKAAIIQLNQLLDQVGDNAKHPLSGLLDVMGSLIEKYEKENFPIPKVNGIAAVDAIRDEILKILD